MATSAFIVKVPTAEPLVGALRERFDLSAKLGVPAHISILFPFMEPKDIDAKVLKKAQHIFGCMEVFTFCLNAIGRFPETAYLSPEAAAPFQVRESV